MSFPNQTQHGYIENHILNEITNFIWSNLVFYETVFIQSDSKSSNSFYMKDCQPKNTVVSSIKQEVFI